MTPVGLRLVNAPIVEAVIDINCDIPPATDLLKLHETAKEALRASYPKSRRQMVQEHEFRKEGEKPPEVSVRQGIAALQFLTEDERQIVQIRPDGFSFNRLAPYKSLDEYLPEIERTWGIFRDLTFPVEVRRIGLRFINRILLPATDETVELDVYLRASPQLPDVDRLVLVGFLNQHSAIEEETGNRVNITLIMQSLEQDKFPLILDIDAYSSGTRPPDHWLGIQDAILSLRTLKNRVFERTLTEECLNLFR
ncbi:MAG TPA: TIGR04255 family protein [Thermoanaerobaculia bacterium]|nr:TIGR04255 family protein [Thermoanaerobaculia bacterium]